MTDIAELAELEAVLNAMPPVERAKAKAKWREKMAEIDREHAAAEIEQAQDRATASCEVQSVQARTISQAVETLAQMQRALAADTDKLGIPFKPLDLSYARELVQFAEKQAGQVSATIIQRRTAA